MSGSSLKRLIEVDLPIKRISAQARREKSIRHGHISTLHIWWARRPLAACRAIILAALWPDPADPNCPDRFRSEAAARMKAFRDRRGGKPRNWSDPLELRSALLDFIADFATWENSTDPDFLETSRGLVQAAHESLGGAPGTRPLVVDPFAGGGAIPLEALRVGADAFASDLNPIPVLLNKVVLEYVPKYGQRLAEEVAKWGTRIKQSAAKDLSEYYPVDPSGTTPIAYVWARTIKCEGPGCGAEVPLIRSLALARNGRHRVDLRLVPRKSEARVDTTVVVDKDDGEAEGGTVRRGACTCPVCGFATSPQNVRAQFVERQGGANDARMLAVVEMTRDSAEKLYRDPTDRDLAGARRAKAELDKRAAQDPGPLSLVPDEPLPYLRSIFNIHLLDVKSWGALFTSRQALAISTFIREVRSIRASIRMDLQDPGLADAVITVLALVPNRCADFASSLTRWIPAGEKIGQTFGRQALGIVWDFVEGNPLADVSGSFERCLDYVVKVLEMQGRALQSVHPGVAASASATQHPLPDDSAQVIVTDPPYYDAVPYADLSDFFYVWLRRALADLHPGLFSESLAPKVEEIVQLAERNKNYSYKTKERFEELMRSALTEARRVTVPHGLAVVVFAHKTTGAWETMLQSVLAAGWVVTASWPIDTEKPGRLRAQNAAALASSVHLVCRPREHPDGSLDVESIGDWREVLAELPKRIHDWMPRLAEEGVVGADAIFACLGPALEVFSRYARVEKASGDEVKLKEYLEHVWAAVSKEALGMIFAGAQTSEFEEDARLTAMWLWTLSTNVDTGTAKGEEEESEADDSEDDGAARKGRVEGFFLEYDAARKIAQGLGINLENLATLVELKGETARLVPVAERTRALFGKAEEQAPARRSKKKDKQMRLGFAAELEEAEEAGGWGEKGVPERGKTVLDRVHQAMILFAASRGEALRRFLVDDGIGSDQRFWRLAQAFAALYPVGTDERRWVEGVLARKKGLCL